MKILIVTDNIELYKWLEKFVQTDDFRNYLFAFVCSPESKDNFEEFQNIKPLSIKQNVNAVRNYDKIISLHCKQFFPKELVNSVKCINIHPGYNPINRGWYPQVFAIINDTDIGATIHEMDENLDSGNIIVREKIKKFSWDTSLSLYERVVELEKKLIEGNLKNILADSYQTTKPESDGFLSTKKNFKELCEINLNEKLTFKQAIDKLRALTHGEYKNAYFYDETRNKIFLKIELEKE